jgi:phosphatidylglycerophosphate synthase
MKESELKRIRECARIWPNWWSNYVTIPMAIRLVAMLRNSSIIPNHLTLLSLTLIAVSSYFIAFGQGYWSLLVAAILIQIAMTLDYADGILARYKKIFSPFGGWFDQICDRIEDFLLIFSFTYRLMGEETSVWIWGFVSLFIVYINEYYGQQRRPLPLTKAKDFFNPDLQSNNPSKIEKFVRRFLTKMKYEERRRFPKLGLFDIGEQRFICSLVLVLNCPMWLFYIFVGYGGAMVVLRPLYNIFVYIIHKNNGKEEEKIR